MVVLPALRKQIVILLHRGVSVFSAGILYRSRNAKNTVTMKTLTTPFEKLCYCGSLLLALVPALVLTLLIVSAIF